MFSPNVTRFVSYFYSNFYFYSIVFLLLELDLDDVLIFFELLLELIKLLVGEDRGSCSSF
jgi:hypothetical protein